MADRSLEVFVRILSDHVGAEKAQEVLKQYRGEVEKTGEATEHTNERMEGSRALFTQLNRIVPELGHLLHAAFEGPVGAVILLGMAVHEVKEKLAEYNEELDKQGEDAFAPHIEAVHALQSAWDEAASHSAEYFSKLAHAGEDENPLETQRKRIEELTHAQIEADKKIIESQAAVAEAYVRTRGARQGLAPEEIQRQIAQVKETAQRNIYGLEDRESQGKIEALQKELENARNLAPLQESTVTNRQNYVRDAQSKFNQNQKDLERLRLAGYDGTMSGEAFEKFKKDHPGDERVQKEEAERTLANLQRNLEVAKNSDQYQSGSPDQRKRFTALDESAIAEQKAKLAALDKAIETNQALFDRLTQTQPQRERTLDDAKNEQSQAEGLLERYKDLMSRLPGEIAQAIAVDKERQRGENSSQVTKVAGQEEQYAVDVARLTSQGKSTPAEQRDLVRIASQIAGHQVSLTEAVSVMNNAASNASLFSIQVGRLVGILSQIKPADLTELTKRINNLESQFATRH